MDSSNAEKACDHRFTNQPMLTRDFCVRCGVAKFAEDEVAVLERRAVHAELEWAAADARAVLAEAAIQSVRDLADKAEHGALRWADPLPVPEWVARVRAVLAEPSSVLAAVKADVWDDGYGDDLEATTPRTNPYRNGEKP